MARYEFTQQFSYTNPGSTAQYSLLQGSAGVYIIKGLSCYSTTGLMVGGIGSSLQLISAASSVSGGPYIFTTTETTTANQSIVLFSPAQQIILTQPYLGSISYLNGSPATFVLNVSYVFIPTTNPNYANFSNHVAYVTNATGASFSGLSATTTTIIKSILIVNRYATDTDIVIYLGGVAVLATQVLAGETFDFPIPLYINNAQTLTVSSSSVNEVTVIYSYTQDVNA